jgi:hypothetical protein
MPRAATIPPTPHSRALFPTSRTYQWHPKNVHLYKSGVSHKGLTPTGETTFILPYFTCLVKVLLTETQSRMPGVLYLGATHLCAYYPWEADPALRSIIDFNPRLSYDPSGAGSGSTRIPPGDHDSHRWLSLPPEDNCSPVVARGAITLWPVER